MGECHAPLVIWIAGAYEYDKWSADDLIVHFRCLMTKQRQHFLY